MTWLRRLFAWGSARREAEVPPAPPGAVLGDPPPQTGRVPVHAVGEAAAPPLPTDLPDGMLWLLQQFEGRRLAPYLCPAGIPTIGIGSTRYPDGRRVTMADPPITDAQAEAMALHDLREAAGDVDDMLGGVPVTRYQRAALALFVHNLGPGALADSTLLRRIRSGAAPDAAEQFDRWNKARDPRTRQLVPLKGLSRRRRAERHLFEGRAPALAWRRALEEFP